MKRLALAVVVLGFGGLARAAPPPTVVEVPLYLSYGVDDDAGRRAEADLLQERNLANQICRPEERDSCRRENERVFRKRLAQVEGASFHLAYAHGNAVRPFWWPIPDEQATAQGLDVLLEQIPQGGSWVGTGVVLRITRTFADDGGVSHACESRRASDGAALWFDWPERVCDLHP